MHIIQQAATALPAQGAGEERPAEEEEPGAGPKAGGDKEEKRAKGIGRKWAALRASGRIPKWILDLFDQAGKETGEGKRAEQTKIINALIKEVEGGGAYAINVADPMLKEKHKNYFKRESEDQRSAVILEEAEVRCGGEDKLKTACREGRVTESVRGGHKFYIFRSLCIHSQNLLMPQMDLAQGPCGSPPGPRWRGRLREVRGKVFMLFYIRKTTQNIAKVCSGEGKVEGGSGDFFMKFYMEKPSKNIANIYSTQPICFTNL